jgi:hypothetical protein
MAGDFSRSATETAKVCEELGAALDSGKLGDIVAKHEKLIMHYYADVQEQAKRSFDSALRIAQIGFWVLIVTLAYALVLDGLRRFNFNVAPAMTETSLTLAGIGTVSGALIEFIAAIAFVLYSKGAKQFGAFHICLERTHRYLLAYKMTEELGGKKEETLRDLVCIMANAPMITRADVDSSKKSSRPEPTRRSALLPEQR